MFDARYTERADLGRIEIYEYYLINVWVHFDDVNNIIGKQSFLRSE